MAMVKALGDADNAKWLEPSHGDGVFIQAVATLGVPKNRIVAIDLDKKIGPADKLAETIRGVDFLRWARTTDLRFDRIMGNPPFVSIKALPVSLKRSAATVVDVNDKPIGESANTWYAFVLASLRLLRKGGALSFVLPSAALFTNYSAAIRAAIHETFESLELYRSDRPLFDGVQEGTVVAVARGYGSRPCKVRRRRFSSRRNLVEALSNSGKFLGRTCPIVNAKPISAMVSLNSIARIRVGGVTGDNEFFLMNDERRKELGLPLQALTPVLSKARHLKGAPVEKQDWRKLKTAGERVWLFNPTASLIRECSRVKTYLYKEQDKGGCNRDAYKIRDRKPWYRTPHLNTVDAFVSGMSQQGPWLCMNEMPELRATNTLYIVNFLDAQKSMRYMWGLAMMSSIAQRQIRGIARRYADGLLKYEPGELAEVELPTLRADVDHRPLYQRAVHALLTNDLGLAKDIADSIRL